MAVVGQLIAKFVSEGLSSLAIDCGAPEAFLGIPVDKGTFEAVTIVQQPLPSGDSIAKARSI